MRFQALDGWRGVGAIFIVLFHIGLIENPFVNHAYLFVDFFCILSGFVIHGAYGKRLDSFAKSKTFLLKRLVRLWPLAALMTLLFFAFDLIDVAGGAPYDWGPYDWGKAGLSLLYNLLLVQGIGFHAPMGWNVPAWFVSCELFLYVTYAALLPLLGGRKLALLGIPAALAGYVALFNIYHRGLDYTFSYGFLRCLSGFALGIALREFAPLLKWTGSRALAAELLAVLGVVGLFAVGGWNPLDFLGPAIFVATIWVFAMEGGPVSTLLKSRPLQWLGARSYALYMVHVFVLARLRGTGVEQALPETLKWPVMVALTFAFGLIAADLAFRQIEERSKGWI